MDRSILRLQRGSETGADHVECVVFHAAGHGLGKLHHTHRHRPLPLSTSPFHIYSTALVPFRFKGQNDKRGARNWSRDLKILFFRLPADDVTVTKISPHEYSWCTMNMHEQHHRI